MKHDNRADRLLYRQWYAIAWEKELGEQPLARRCVGLPIVLFRDAEHQIAAIADRCPHRFAPLSRGRAVGGTLYCGYHGLGFDRTGRCVVNPHAEAIPATAHLRSYPVSVRNGVIWLWPSDSPADPNLIPEYPSLDLPGDQLVMGTTLIAAPYEMAADNLFDLSHVMYLHGGAFGATDQSGAIRTVRHEGDEVTMDWWIAGRGAASEWEAVWDAKSTDPMDSWMSLRWRAPGNILLEIGIVDRDRPRMEGKRVHLVNLLTPEDSVSTRYLWAAARVDAPPSSPDARAVLESVLKHAFDRDDGPMIEACYSRMDGVDVMKQHPLILPTDAGAVRARGMISRLLASEAAEAR